MPITVPFETRTDEYDAWYDEYAGAYHAERAALERALSAAGPVDRTCAVEVGVGTGRFAASLGVSVGIDPAGAPLEYARDRGVEPVRGVAEFLPIADDSLDLLLLTTVLCFVDDLEATLAECRRVLAADGALVVGTLDRESPMGQVYREHKSENPFYAPATFHAAVDLLDGVEEAGFAVEERYQTVFGDSADVDSADPEIREGHGEGLFAVFRARPR